MKHGASLGSLLIKMGSLKPKKFKEATTEKL